MLIEQIIKESQNTTKVSFIDNGLFCNVYNESAYIATELLGLKLKLRVITVKKLNNQKVIVGGLPKESILKRFEQAIPTLWGFELQGHFDTRGYSAWLARAVANVADQAEHAVAQVTKNSANKQNQKAYQATQGNYVEQDNRDQYCLYLPLTHEQLDYLLAWQEGSSLASMQDFMTDLRSQAIWQCITNTIKANQE